MIWAYYRVSTGRQDIDSQRLGVLEYAKRMGYTIDKEVIDDGVSGTIKAKDRKLRIILKQAKEGDVVIVSELSRLGRSTIDVLNTCDILGKKKVDVWFVKQSIGLDQSPMGKMILAILSAFSEMERDLISQRTTEGLKKAKANGKVLGRRFGFHPTNFKLEELKNRILKMKKKGETITKIAKVCSVNRTTIYRYLKKWEEV